MEPDPHRIRPSGAPPRPSAGIADDAPARALLGAAFDEVESAHGGFGENFASSLTAALNKADLERVLKEKLGTKQKRTDYAVGALVMVGGAAATAGVAATGGLGAPVVAALFAAGAWATKKAVQKGLSEEMADKRFKNYHTGAWSSLAGESRGARSREVTEDASEAIRRLVVHLHRAEGYFNHLLASLRDISTRAQKCIASAVEAKSICKLMMQLEADLEMVCRYLLPCAFALEGNMVHFIELAKKWNQMYAANVPDLVKKYLALPDAGVCKKSEACYHPARGPAYPSIKAPSNWTFNWSSVQERFNEIAELDVGIVNQMDSSTVNNWSVLVDVKLNEWAEKPGNSTRDRFARKGEFAKVFLHELCNPAAEEVAAEAKGIPIIHGIQKVWDRSVKSEVAGMAVDNLAGFLLAAATPFLDGAVDLSGLAEKAMDKGVTLASAGAKRALPSAAEKATEKLTKDKNCKDLCEMNQGELNQVAKDLEKFFKKVADHGTLSNDIFKTLGDPFIALGNAGKASPTSCSHVEGMVMPFMLFYHHMRKFELYMQEVHTQLGSFLLRASLLNERRTQLANYALSLLVLWAWNASEKPPAKPSSSPFGKPFF